MLCLCCFLSGVSPLHLSPLPLRNSHASFKTHLTWHLLCGGFPVLSQLLAFMFQKYLILARLQLSVAKV